MGEGGDQLSIFELVGDETVREILVLANEQPVSAGLIAEHTDTSLSTVYRRLDTLTGLGLLREEICIGPEGTRYRQFETVLEHVSCEIADSGFDITIRLSQDVSNRFGTFLEGTHPDLP